MTELTTKDKILNISHKLFSDQGVDAVSIREIAKACEVNIAAVNYYFQNKENLYRETVKLSISRMHSEIGRLFEQYQNQSINDFSLAVFDHLVANGKDLRTTFKLVISATKNNLVFSEESFTYKGPPGGEFLHQVIANKFPNANDEDVEWAVRTIFTQIVHKALVMGNESLVEAICQNGRPCEMMRSDISRLVDLVIKHFSEQ